MTVPTTTDIPAAPSRATAALARTRTGLLRALEMVCFLVVLVVLWWAAVVGLSIPSMIIPSPVAVGQSIVEFHGLLIQNTFITVGEALVGFAIAVVVGIAIAIGIVLSDLASRLALPLLVGINSAPKVVVAPILVIWLGFGVMSKIGMAFLLCFFPVIISAIQGLREVEPDLIDFYRLMQASDWTIMRKVRLPNSVPYLLSGFKIALPTALIGAVIGEFVVAKEGIGQQILMAYSTFNTDLVFAGVIIVTVASVILFQLLVWVERLVLAWRPFSAGARTR